MKKINFPIVSFITLLFCVLSFQSALAVEVPLKKGETGPATMSKSTSILPVSVSLDDTTLGVFFSKPVGIAQITIEDESGNVIYQDVVNTNSSLESYIETGGFDSGNYTLKVSYGTTTLIGSFQL
ncbi:hypothetical protein Palpr_1902 [Paludibacter propionicigenes WB4]|uniref:DUF3244 domain-containing protein n=1 Tax=Paludibacter propionicigenes (strain DSM 17365 / JCM 13257 / WB4) TaxID=694427 RepID=E4T5P7_PALPW|nr:DUF3244 domain-containing protein [Paludibacter propionicigenes]ADQ80041.1 hypothetical protein Palpr_1902 [Paludibacter propionicigenes WB4]